MLSVRAVGGLWVVGGAQHSMYSLRPEPLVLPRPTIPSSCSASGHAGFSLPFYIGQTGKGLARFNMLCHAHHLDCSQYDPFVECKTSIVVPPLTIQLSTYDCVVPSLVSPTFVLKQFCLEPPPPCR